MRTLNSSLNKEITGRFVRPVYLLEIEYEAGKSFRFHSGDGGTGTPLTVTGISTYSLPNLINVWTGNDFKVSGVGWDTVQNNVPTVSIQNMDVSMSAAFLNNTVTIADRPIKLWTLYVYERQILTLAATAASGATNLSVTTVIPAEVGATGNLDFTGTGTYNKTFTSRTTNSLVLGATLTSALSVGTQIYIAGPGITGTYGSTDVIPLFNGVVNEIELDEKRVTVTMLSQSAKTQYVPNRYITKYNNFNWLPKTGTIIIWGNETFILEKATF